MSKYLDKLTFRGSFKVANVTLKNDLKLLIFNWIASQIKYLILNKPNKYTGAVNYEDI